MSNSRLTKSESQLSKVEEPLETWKDGEAQEHLAAMFSPKSAHASAAMADGAGGNQLFVDQEKMKEKLRQKMMKAPYNVANYYKKTGLAQRIARSPLFEAITLGVISFNALWISIDTDANDEATLLEADPIFIIAENLFCVYFSCELMIRFLAFQHKCRALRDAWFVFDACLVFLMVLETWVIVVVGLVMGGSSSSSLGNASILRMARLLRLTRLARMARLLRSMPELMILVRGMIAGTRSVIFTLVMLLGLLYVFAVAFRQLTDGSEVGNRWFPSVLISMHNLLVHGTFMDDIAGISKDLAENGVFLVPVFYLFVLLASLTLMNMLLGVLCEVVSAVASTEKEAMTIAYVKDVLQDILLNHDLDTNKDGQISKTEFMALFENETATRLLEEVGVDVVGLVDYSDFLFEGDGEADGEATLSYEDLMSTLLDLRGTNTTTVRDIVDLRKFVKTQIDGLEERLGRSLERKDRGRKSSMANGFSHAGLGFEKLVAPAIALPAVQATRKAPQNTIKDASMDEGKARRFNVKHRESLERSCQSLEGLLSECQSLVAPVASSLDHITNQLVAGLQAVKQHDQDFAEMRLENQKMIEEIANLKVSQSGMPGVPNCSPVNTTLRIQGSSIEDKRGDLDYATTQSPFRRKEAFVEDIV